MGMTSLHRTYLAATIIASAISILNVDNSGLHAATLTWNPAQNATGGSDGAGTWGGSATNWYDGTSATAWTNGSDVVFGSGSAGGTVTLSGAQSVNTMTFNQSGYVLTGGAITFGFNSGSNNYNLGPALTLTNGTSAEIASGIQGVYTLMQAGTTSAGSASTLKLSGGTSGSFGSLGLSGYGTVNLTSGTYNLSVLQSTVTNVIQKSATVSTGTFIMGPAPANSPSTTNYTMDAADAALTVTTGDMQIARNGKTAIFNLKQGTLKVNTGSLSLISSDYSSTATFNMEGGSASIAGNLVINNSGGATLNSKVAKALISGGTMSVSGIRFGNNGTSLYTTGSAGQLSLTGGNLYIGSGGIYEGTNHPVSDTITLSGGTLGANADWSSSMAMTLATTNGNIKIKSADASDIAHLITLSGTLSGTGGLTKIGSGVLNLTGSNTYTGGTVISEGILRLGSSATLANATGSIALSGGQLESISDSTIGSDLVISGGILSIGNSSTAMLTLAAGKNVTLTSGTIALTVAGDQTDAISGSGTITITGGVIDLLGNTIDYSRTYQIFNGFTNISISGLGFINYDADHYAASINENGTLSFSALATPEISTLWALTAGAMGLLMRRRHV